MCTKRVTPSNSLMFHTKSISFQHGVRADYVCMQSCVSICLCLTRLSDKNVTSRFRLSMNYVFLGLCLSFQTCYWIVVNKKQKPKLNQQKFAILKMSETCISLSLIGDTAFCFDADGKKHFYSLHVLFSYLIILLQITWKSAQNTESLANWLGVWWNGLGMQHYKVATWINYISC